MGKMNDDCDQETHCKRFYAITAIGSSGYATKRSISSLLEFCYRENPHYQETVVLSPSINRGSTIVSKEMNEDDPADPPMKKSKLSSKEPCGGSDEKPPCQEKPIQEELPGSRSPNREKRKSESCDEVDGPPANLDADVLLDIEKVAKIEIDRDANFIAKITEIFAEIPDAIIGYKVMPEESKLRYLKNLITLIAHEEIRSMRTYRAGGTRFKLTIDKLYM